ncbi:MAG: ArgE/DapE family deacylase [Chloroflexota bacterium]|nr:ArgE/DapE family deacylase [Chloroflexota bacterium]
MSQMQTADVAAITSAVAGLREPLVAALQELVRTESHTGNEGAVQAVVARLMREQGLSVETWEPSAEALAPYAEHVTLEGGFNGRPNVAGTLEGAGSGRSLILNGHIDTVDAADVTAWDADPHSGAIRDGVLFGRGSCDMKAGVVTNLFALRALQSAGLAPGGTVIVESTIAEEDGGAGALAAILRGYVADACVITEPTDLDIVVAHGGSLMFRLIVPGLAAHAATRNEGVSAIEKFSCLHAGLLAFEARRNAANSHPLYAHLENKIPLSIGTVHAGTWASTVPDLLIAEGRAGLAPGEDLETFKDEFAAEVQAIAAGDPWLREHPPRVEWLAGQFAPSQIATDHELVKVLSEAAREVLPATPAVSGVTYGADMRHFVNTGGMPCLMFGAGDVRQAHAPNESIRIDDILTATTILALFIARWCGVSDRPVAR